MLVADASVVAKLFLDEEDKELAASMFRQAVATDSPLLVPDILVFECMSVGLRRNVPPDVIHDILQTAFRSFLRRVVPDREIWRTAIEIARGHPDHGLPGLGDSLYHAVAIVNGATLVTADRGHLNKTRRWGHAIALADWRH